MTQSIAFKMASGVAGEIRGTASVLPKAAIALVYWDKGDKSQAKAMYQRAINLDSRYRQSSLLSHLKLVGFSPDQIELTNKIQKYTKT
ncbi:MAG: hypothetical protein VKL41_01265 [Snowella sp.]|nr:hypothetical protein [Snowella sp.]